MCRFYGKSGVAGILIPTVGNQCALILMAHSPCRLEISGRTPDEMSCELVSDAAAIIADIPAVAYGPAEAAENLLVAYGRLRVLWMRMPKHEGSDA